MINKAPSLRIFWACAIAVIAALVWITIHALRLENRESLAQANASRQEATRLALWRMDSALTPVIAREASRPYFHYQSFYPTDRAFTRMLDEVQPGDVLVPSPLLHAPIGLIRLYYQASAAGELSSPQIPQADQRRLAESSNLSPTSIVAAQDYLTQLATLRAGAKDEAYRDLAAAGSAALTQESKKEEAAPEAPAPTQSLAGSLNNEFEQRYARQSQARASDPSAENTYINKALEEEQSRKQAAAPSSAHDQKFKDAVESQADETRRVAEFDAKSPPPPVAITPKPAGEKADSPDRAESRDDPAYARKRSTNVPEAPADRESIEHAPSTAAPSDPAPAESTTGTSAEITAPSPAPVAMTDLTPTWIGPTSSPQLVFKRFVTIGGDTFEQGFWLDWQLTRSWLLSDIGDLLPWADLVPVLEDLRNRPAEALGRTLASIPAELVIRQPLALASPAWTPMRWVLMLSWLAVLAALTVTWRTLQALHDLAERRGRFAAAVTHELRTPLTTFCLYSQMLADGMVPTEERRTEYLHTIRSESTRLAGIVESVLEYARLGRRSPGQNIQHLDLHTMLAPLVEKLRENAASNGFDLQSDISAAAGTIVRADPTGLERILTNLIDNACKYARGHAPEVIRFSVSTTRRHAIITIKDHGPGLTTEEQRRIFEPYFRGPRTTDLGVPGLGLGLALAQGVARSMDGDLKLSSSPQNSGASFSLLLSRV